MTGTGGPFLVGGGVVVPAAARPADFVRYYLGEGGSVGKVEAAAETAATIPAGTTEITQDEYEQRLASILAANDQEMAAMVADDDARRRGDFDQLTGLGLSADLAARLSGHTPDPA